MQYKISYILTKKVLEKNSYTISIKYREYLRFLLDYLKDKII